MKKIISNFLIFVLVITMVQIPSLSVMAEATQESTTTIIDYTNFQSALYRRDYTSSDVLHSFSDATGVTTGNSNTPGMAGYLRTSTTNIWDLYCNVNINNLYGKNIETAKLWFCLNGNFAKAAVWVWSAEGDFTPGETMRKDIPERNTANKIATVDTNDTNTDAHLVSFDVTDYLDSIVSEGKTGFSFGIGITTGWTCQIANETTSNESYRPYLEVTYTDRLPEVVSCPSSGEEISCNVPVSVEFSNKIDDTTVNSASVKLFKGEEAVTLSDEDIEVNSGAITVTASKEPDATYTLKLASSIKDIYGYSIGEEGLEYSFNTIFSTASITVQSNPTASKTKVWAGVYDPTNPDDVGITAIYTDAEGTNPVPEGENTNYLPRLSNGENVLYDYYLKADISAYKDLNISNVTLSVLVSGVPTFDFYKLESGIFSPGTTKYSALPSVREKFTSYSDDGGTEWREIDVTEYVRELVLKGETTLGLLIKQTNPENSVAITNELYYSSKRTKFVATVEYDQFIDLGSSLPANEATNVETDANLEITIKTADITTAPTTENVVLLNNKTNEKVVLANSDITYNAPARKLIINPSADLDMNTSYTLTVKNLKAGDTEQIKDIVISFTTENIALEIGEIVLDKSAGTATVVVSKNVDEAGLGDEMMLIIAAYDDGCMTSVKLDSKQSLALGENIFSATLENFSGAQTVKAFLWQSFDEITPIKKAE